MTDWKKSTLILLLGGGSALFACGPFFPSTYIDEEDARVVGVEEKELVHHLELLAEHFMHDVVPHSPRSAEADPAPPRREYELYEAGVREITENPKECFPEAWRQLLALPPAERRYRTVRTLYMLGNLALRNRDDEAAAWRFYHQLRKAVRDEGFPDNLGLSPDTFNALRRYSTPLGQLRALPLAARFRASDVVYHTELEAIVKSLSAEERAKALRDPYLAELLLLADPRNVRTAGHRFLLADRLAMRAYQKGNLELCAELLKQAPDHSLIKLFLEARFARFRGDSKEAVRLLRRWLELSGSALETSPQYRFRRSDPDNPPFAWRQEVYGLIGLVTLEENDYQEALYAFLQAKSWADAALIAEQYMSLPALRKFLDAHRVPSWPDDEDNMTRLRHLYARALLRKGDAEEAAKFFPPRYEEMLEEYRKELKTVRSPAADAETQARAFFRLGQVQLRGNIELLGYELDPDFHICDGNYPNYTPRRLRRRSELPRFHYRRTIAESFRRAAALTQDRELQFVSLLAAGWTLRDREPKAADADYKQLCRMKLEPLSGILDRNRWFPKAPKGWRTRIGAVEPTAESLQTYLRELEAAWRQTVPSAKPE